MSSWTSWSTDVFSKANNLKKPILAAVGPVPPADLRAFESDIHQNFIAVLVDPHSRPDVAIRIGLSHAVVLSHDGCRRAVLPLPAADLAATLRRLASEAQAMVAGRPDGADNPVWTGAVREKPLSSPPGKDVVDGYFASLPLLPGVSDEILEALLYASCERGDKAALVALVAGLGSLIAREWNESKREFLPGPQSPLVTHARRARLFWDAYCLTGDQRWHDMAMRISDYLLQVLYDPSLKAFRQAKDLSLYPADGNALAALALLRADVFNVVQAGPAALAALTFIQSRLYDPLLGIIHAQGESQDSVHGLLGDISWTALASTEAFLATGQKSHREFADELVRFLFQELWDREGGGFLDRVNRPDDPPILREPHVDAHLNAVALEVCWRLHHLKGNTNYRRWLDWGLRGAWPWTASDPMSLSGLARLADMALRGRADFELIGRVGEPKAQSLLNALRRHYLPRAIVSFVDPDDQDYILAHKLTADSYPRLFGCGRDLRRLADAGDEAAVASVVSAVHQEQSL